MIYASSKDTIKKSFTGLSLEFQANDEGDLDYTTLREEVETRNAQIAYVVVQFYPWFEFYILLSQTHYHTLPYPKTKENKI